MTFSSGPKDIDNLIPSRSPDPPAGGRLPGTAMACAPAPDPADSAFPDECILPGQVPAGKVTEGDHELPGQARPADMCSGAAYLELLQAPARWSRASLRGVKPNAR